MRPDVPKGKAIEALRGTPNAGSLPSVHMSTKGRHWEQVNSLGDNPAEYGQSLDQSASELKRRRHGSLAGWFSDVLRHGGTSGLSSDRRGGDLLKRSAKLARCCSYGAVHVPGGDPVCAIWVPYRCDDRFCPDCHWHRTKGTRTRLLDALQISQMKGQRVRFTTLTAGTRGRFKTPEAAYTALAKGIKKFTRSRAFTDHVDGYFAAFEVTVNEAGQLHPHWHILWQGRPWPDTHNAWATWKGSNGGRLDYADYLKARGRCDRIRVAPYMRSVWGRAVSFPEPSTETKPGEVDSSRVWEVTKYVAAPPIKKLEDLPDPRGVQAQTYAQIAAQLAGRRMGRTGGNWYGISKDDEKPPGQEVHVTTVAELERLARGHEVTEDRITTPGGDLDARTWAALCLKSVSDRVSEAWKRQQKKERSANWRKSLADVRQKEDAPAPVVTVKPPPLNLTDDQIASMVAQRPAAY